MISKEDKEQFIEENNLNLVITRIKDLIDVIGDCNCHAETTAIEMSEEEIDGYKREAEKFEQKLFEYVDALFDYEHYLAIRYIRDVFFGRSKITMKLAKHIQQKHSEAKAKETNPL